MKSALILYPHQLFPLDKLPQVDAVLMVEEPLYFGIDREYPLKLHKQKLILHRASMRRYVEEVLWPAGIEVDYVSLDGLMTSEDIFGRARKFEQLYLFDPIDDVLTKRLLQARRADNTVPPFEFLTSPNFYLKNQEIQGYFADKHKQQFADFYQWQRERFNILIDENYKPVGGKWILESAKQGKLPKDAVLPSFAVFGSNQFVDDATKYVEQHFPDNPGSTDFIWPTNHEEAAKWLGEFVEHRLDGYGQYEHAIDQQAVWLYHSALSSSLNIGLLSPQQVVDAALQRHAKRPVELANLEKFIQQILGRREFTRGQYITQQSSLRGVNVFGHKRKMTPDWRNGTLELPPFDAMMKRINQHAYVPHNERLLVAGNLMVLCEIDPTDVHKWFSELFIDSYDWATMSTVYGMSHFADSMFAVEPCITSSDNIEQLSNYQHGDWSDVWDGLYWRFIDKHRDRLKTSTSLRGVVQQLDKLDLDRRRIIGYRAEDFLNKYTR